MQANSNFFTVEKQRFFVQLGQSFSLFFFHRWLLKISKALKNNYITIKNVLLRRKLKLTQKLVTV